MNQILPFQDVKSLANNLHKEHKRIVLTGGCFDLLHFGHITLLEESKKQGDILVVLLESDASIKKLKGSDRPLHTQKERAHMLTSLKSVDYVILLPDVMNNEIYDEVVKWLQPAIIATTEGSTTLVHIERQAKMVHAQVYLVKPVPNLSTSRILEVVTKEL